MDETFYRYDGIPVSVALLTDLHGRPYQTIIDSIKKQCPDIITIVGDFIVGYQPESDCSPLETQENVLPFLKACAGLRPTYLSLGNHEWLLDSEDLETIASTGVTVLDNTVNPLDPLVKSGSS